MAEKLCLLLFGFRLEDLKNLLGEDWAITVHDGSFHADDVFAVAFIFLLCRLSGLPLPAVIRTRDKSKAKGVCVDVFEGLFDHHGARAGIDPCGTPWSGATRLWFWFLDLALLRGSRAHEIFYNLVLKPLSKIDNGKELEPGEVTLFSFVPVFNPGYGDEDELEASFFKAVKIAEDIILGAWAKAQADAKGEEVMAEIVELAQHEDVVTVPVGLDDLWPEALVDTKAKLVIISAPTGTHFIQSVPSSKANRFSAKVLAPMAWRGHRDKEFQEISGYSSGVFCHVAGFISGATDLVEAHCIARDIINADEH